MTAAPSGDSRIGTAEMAHRSPFSRDTLDRMVAESPLTLPGAPTNFGKIGGKRRRLLWDPTRFEEWLVAYGAWRASLAEPEKRASSQRKPQNASKGEQGRGRLTLAEITAGRKRR